MNLTSGVQNGILTRNEAREQLGYDTMDGADELLVSATLMPLTQANEETPKDEDIPEEVEYRTIIRRRLHYKLMLDNTDQMIL